MTTKREKALPLIRAVMKQGRIFTSFELSAYTGIHIKTTRSKLWRLHVVEKVISIVGWDKGPSGNQWTPQYQWGIHEEPENPTIERTKEAREQQRKAVFAKNPLPSYGIWGI